MRRVLAYAAVGVVAYAAALAAFAPAELVAHVIRAKSAERVILRATEGSVWSGSGVLFVQSHGAIFELGRLRWTASPRELLSGRLAADVFVGASRGMRVAYGPGSLGVRDVELEIPASLAARLAPVLETFGPEGQIRVRSESFRMDGDAFLGQASIEWRRARLARAGGVEVGSLVARFLGARDRVDIELSTLDGPLQVNGRGAWIPGNGLSVSGTAEAPSDPSGRLNAFLKGVCSEYRDGRCAFRAAL